MSDDPTLETEARLRAAVLTMLALPAEDPGLVGLGLPDGAWAAFAARRASLTHTLPLPDPGEVRLMREAMSWLGWVDEATAEVIWGRAAGERWTVMSQYLRMVRPALWRRWKDGVVMITLRRRRAGRAGPPTTTAGEGGLVNG